MCNNSCVLRGRDFALFVTIFADVTIFAVVCSKNCYKKREVSASLSGSSRVPTCQALESCWVPSRRRGCHFTGTPPVHPY